MNRTDDSQQPSKNLTAALIIWPAASLILVFVGFLLLQDRLPRRIVRHVGPDGEGYGSLLMFILGAVLIAGLLFVIGGCLVSGYLKRGHLYGLEKMISVSLLAGGYGVAAIGACVLLANLNVHDGVASGQAVGVSLLGFVCAFVAAAVIYARALPQAKLESL
ncbi:hypothetical protein GCM10027591_08140 [Zhihengliuella somnathii]